MLNTPIGPLLNQLYIFDISLSLSSDDRGVSISHCFLKQELTEKLSDPGINLPFVFLSALGTARLSSNCLLTDAMMMMMMMI